MYYYRLYKNVSYLLIFYLIFYSIKEILWILLEDKIFVIFYVFYVVIANTYLYVYLNNITIVCLTSTLFCFLFSLIYPYNYLYVCLTSFACFEYCLLHRGSIGVFNWFNVSHITLNRRPHFLWYCWEYSCDDVYHLTIKQYNPLI